MTASSAGCSVRPPPKPPIETNTRIPHLVSAPLLVVPNTSGLAISEWATPNPVYTLNNLTYTVSELNRGPLATGGVIVSNGLPAGVAFVSCQPSQPTFTYSGGTVILASHLQEAKAGPGKVIPVAVRHGGFGHIPGFVDKAQRIHQHQAVVGAAIEGVVNKGHGQEFTQLTVRIQTTSWS
jgi:uncharacterized repeat protein (TIGR01451 family)